MGKTQLAVMVFEAARVDLRVWVTATSVDRLVTGFADAAQSVQSTGWDDDDPARAARGFLGWLSTTTKDWLVILDDLSLTNREVSTWWPPATEHGRLLITTRIRGAGVSGGTRPINVDKYSDREATDYIVRRIEAADDGFLSADLAHGSAELAAELGCLPIALAQAASVMINDDISASQYLERFRDRTRSLAEVMRDWDDSDGYDRAVAATWSLAVEGANRLDPVGLAHPAALLAAVLDPAGVAESVWTCATGREVLALLRADLESDDQLEAEDDQPEVEDDQPEVEDDQPEVEDDHQLEVEFEPDPVSVDEARGALRALHRYSLVQHIPADEATAVRMHALTQRALRDTLDPEYLEDVVLAAADVLSDSWPENRADPELAASFRASVAMLDEHSTSAMWVPDAHVVLFQSGHSLLDAGLYAQGRDYFAALAEAAREHLGADHIDTLLAQGARAFCQGYAGDSAGAVRAYDEVINELMQVQGATSLNTLLTRANRAYFQGQSGDYSGAISAYDELIPDIITAQGPTSPDTLQARANRALFQGRAGDYIGAVRAYDELIPDLVLAEEPGSPDALLAKCSRAVIQGWAGDYAGAVRAYDELLPDLSAVLGATHPDTVLTRANRAFFQGQAGDYAGAVRVYDELIPDLNAVLGPTHPNSLQAKANRAGFQGQTGDHLGAVSAFEALIPELAAIQGLTHPDTLQARVNQALFQGQSGDFTGAVSALDDLIPDLVSAQGATYPDTLTARANRAYFRGRAGEYADAVRDYEELMPLLSAGLGAAHPGTLQSRGNLTGFRGLAGDHLGALRAFDELIPDLTDVLGDAHPTTLQARGMRAFFQGLAGDRVGAIRALDELVPPLRRVLGDAHPDTLKVRGNLAAFLGDTGHLVRAVAEYEQLSRLHQSFATPRDRWTATLLDQIATSDESPTTDDLVQLNELLPNLVVSAAAYEAATKAFRAACRRSSSTARSTVLLHSLLLLHGRFGADDDDARLDEEAYLRLTSTPR